MTPLRGRLAGVRRTLFAVLAIRTVLVSTAVAAGVLFLAFALDSVFNLPRPVRLGLAGSAVACGMAVVLWFGVRAWRLRSNEVLALWIEANYPLDYVLITAVDTRFSSDNHLVDLLESRPFETRARRAAWRGVRGPAGALVAALIGLALIPAHRLARVVAPRPGDVLSAGAGRGTSRIRPIVVRYVAPAYAGSPSVTLEEPAAVQGLEGGEVTITGLGPAGGVVGSLGDRTLLPGSREGGWGLVLPMPGKSAVLRLVDGTDERLLALESIADSVPAVVLRLPARDTVVRTAPATMVLEAIATDDHGVASAWFEYIVSSGTGELFEFRTGTVGRHVSIGRVDSLRFALDLDALRLEPGDALHVRAVARDRGPAARGTGASDTRSLRVARAGESDTSAVIVMPPLPSDTAALSQRMLILLAEALETRRPRLGRATVVTESGRIGRDQARLRRDVADVIFLRLSGEAEGEHAHGVEADSATVLTPEQLLEAAEAATSSDPGQQLDFHEDEAPVVAVNRPLLEAYNAMWDASRELDVGEPGRALPHMRAALDAIQRARAAERVYLRGRASRVVVNLERVRMSGKREGIVIAPRSAQPQDSPAGRRDRLLAAIALLPADVGAARDSLLVLRIDLLEEEPTAAAAVSEALAALRSAGDARPALSAARARLGGASSVSRGLTSWGTAGRR